MQQLRQLLLLLLLLVQLAAADIFLYGARHEVPHYAYGYVGLDWPEEYEVRLLLRPTAAVELHTCSPTCPTAIQTCMGSRQSPIQIPGHTSELDWPQAVCGAWCTCV